METGMLQKFATVLLDYSLQVKPGEYIVVNASTLAQPLVEQVYAGLLERGAFPLLRLALPQQEELFHAHARDRHFTTRSPFSAFEAKRADGWLTIMASANTRALAGTDPRRHAQLLRTSKPVRAHITRKDRWTLTLFPTPAYAQDAGMGLHDFERFVARALFLDRRDPLAAWRTLQRRQETLVRRLCGAQQVRVTAPGTDLTLRVTGRSFINSCGYRNMPSGEVFTSPVEDSAEGVITFALPACHGGREVEGVRLVFRHGAVVEASARRGDDYLQTLLGTDAGAKRIGEFAFGLNYGIDRPCKNILFDEKIGGTVHLALGDSFAEAGGKNKSALHWDLICDLRREGVVTVDGVTVMRNGKLTG
ncbi:MAG TPA: aminopeptidase [bacterium]|nr:aminopeptidase [bacterium]